MAVTISETQSNERLGSSWAQIVLALEPLVSTLPEPYKSFFNSPVKLMIGNKISLAIIPPRHMWSYIEHADLIYNLIESIDYFGYYLETMLFELSSFLTRLGLSMSVNGEFLIRGPMSTQTTQQRQELVGLTTKDIQAYRAGGGR